MLIAFEGIDGSGKATQAAMLRDNLLRSGYKVQSRSFPNYKSHFGRLVRNYLDGAYGDIEQAPVLFASLLYMCDRVENFASMEHIVDSKTSFVILDRYIASNMVHQAAKLPKDQQQAMMKTLRTLECEALRLPWPDITILLDLPAEVAAKRIQERKGPSDIHETNQAYLQRTADLYVELAAAEGNWLTIPVGGYPTVPEQTEGQEPPAFREHSAPKLQAAIVGLLRERGLSRLW